MEYARFGGTGKPWRGVIQTDLPAQIGAENSGSMQRGSAATDPHGSFIFRSGTPG